MYKPPRSAWAKRVTLQAAVIVGVLGIAALVGWHLHLVALFEILPTLVPTQRMTALGFALIGAALFAAATGHRLVAVLCTLVVVIEAILVCLEYALNISFGIDQLLGPDYINMHTSNLGRMSPVTALCFLGSCVAVLAIAKPVPVLFRYSAAVCGILATVLISVSVVNGLGILLGHPWTYGWSRFTRMSLHTSAGFVFIGVGFLAWAWQERPQSNSAPDWLPLSIGLGLATGALGVYQALLRHQERDLPMLSGIILAGGLAGAFLIALATAQAVQARRRSCELQEGKDVLERVLEAPPDVLLLVDRQGRIVRVNRHVEAVFGYRPDELLGASIDTLVPAKLRERHRLHRESYHASPSPRAMGSMLDLRACRKDGSEFPVEISIGPVDSGGETQVLAVVRDITERRQAQEELRQSEERFRRIFEQGPLGVVLVGPDGRMIRVNPAFCQMLGYSEGELTRMTAFDITYPDDLDVSANAMKHLFTGDQTINKVEKRYVKKNGEIMWGSLSASPVCDREGRPLYGLGMLEDITARKEMEAQIEASRERMAASARLSALGMMAGGVAHEINNPLAIIHASAADLLRKIKKGNSVPAAFALRNSERILKTANRITQIIRSMRRVAREGSEDRVSPTAVSQIVEETLALCQERIKHHAVNLILPNIDPTLLVSCREVQIAQVLMNLLQNAFDAVVEGPGEKWIRLDVTADRGSVVFSVSDSGPGVPAVLKTQVMEPFFTTKEVGKGTGLGLSVSRAIIEEHGAKLEIKEEAGHPCFSFRLPVSQKEERVCD